MRPVETLCRQSRRTDRGGPRGSGKSLADRASTLAKSIITRLAFCGLALCPVPAAAFATDAAATPAAAANILPAGTAVHFLTRTELSSRDGRVGEEVDLEVAEDVILNGRVAIAAGTPAVGEVTAVRHRGVWGQGGMIEVELRHVRLADRTIPVSGRFSESQRPRNGAVMASLALLPVFALLLTGSHAVIPAGTFAVGHTLESVEIETAGQAP